MIQKTDMKQVREQAAQYGLNSLRDAELLKLLGFSGSVSFEELIRKGNIKAQAIVNMVRRYEYKSKYIESDFIKKSQDAAKHFLFLEELYHEEFWLMTLNTAHRVINKHRISTGSQTGTVVDVRDIVRKCLDDKATAYVLCHNHPSGTLKPSEQDRIITRQVSNAGNLFSLNLVDHIIIGNANDGAGTGCYLSFADEGLL